MDSISCLPTQTLHMNQLSTGAIHIWRVGLDRSPLDIEELWLTLSADEQVRANRFFFQADRTRFIVSRGLLRVFLGGYLDTEAASLCFCYGPQGKPSLSLAHAARVLHFNVSHSNTLAVFAFSWQRIGVDIEYMYPIPDIDSITKLVFTKQENVVFHLLPVEQQMEVFFKVWTCKEAYLKPTASGFSQAPDDIDLLL